MAYEKLSLNDRVGGGDTGIGRALALGFAKTGFQASRVKP
jgi:hypothetical protein